MTDPTTNPPLSDDKEQLVVAAVNWRVDDRDALANKRNRDAQRREYRSLNKLRAAADKLLGKP